jgi:hypothetical protein
VAPERAILAGATVVTMAGAQDDVVTVDEYELTQSPVRAHRPLPAPASTLTCKEGMAS